MVILFSVLWYNYNVLTACVLVINFALRLFQLQDVLENIATPESFMSSILLGLIKKQLNELYEQP